MPSAFRKCGATQKWPVFADLRRKAAGRSGRDQTIVSRKSVNPGKKETPSDRLAKVVRRGGLAGLNAPEELTLELRRAPSLPAAAPHDVKQERDAGKHEKCELLELHCVFLIGPKRTNL
jgi:hypothetical protein